MCKTNNATKGMKFDIPDFYDLEQDIIRSVSEYMDQKDVEGIDTSDEKKGILPFIAFEDGDESRPKQGRILAVRVRYDDLEILPAGPDANCDDDDCWIDVHSNRVYYADALMSLAGGLPAFTKDYESTKHSYTFRFHRHAWTDITVEAKDEETAQELADEKYNNGEYEDSDEAFENTYVELVKTE